MEAYLAADGNWGNASGLLKFDPEALPAGLQQLLEDKPEDAYWEIRSWLVNEGKL